MSRIFRHCLPVILAAALVISRFLCVGYAGNLEESSSSIAVGKPGFSAAVFSTKESHQAFPIFELFEENNEDEDKLKKLKAYTLLSFFRFSHQGVSSVFRPGKLVCSTSFKIYLTHSILRI